MSTTQRSMRRHSSRPATLLNIKRKEAPKDIEEEEEEIEEETPETEGFSEPTEEEVMDWNTDHLTKIGTPDRRFKENRALTEEDVSTSLYRRASSGSIVDGIHVTSDGTPDRRYKENRALSDEEVEIRKAEIILAKHGLTRNEISPTAILARHAPSSQRAQAMSERPSGTRQRTQVPPAMPQKAAGGQRRR